MALLVIVAMAVRLWPAASGTSPDPVAAADPGTVTIVAGTPASIDPARHGDLGSASFVSQLYETLTAVDPSLTVRPALAESWAVTDDGRQVTFTLREGLTFSDGTPLTAADVVHSWRRLFTPANRSPLASLVAEIVGARDLAQRRLDRRLHAGRAGGGRPYGDRRPRARRRRPAGDRVERAVRHRARDRR